MNKPQRKLTRLKGFDYTSSEIYFVTIVTHRRLNLFGAIDDESMMLSDIGAIASDRWRHLPDYFPDLVVDPFIVMPNHVHGLVDVTAMNTYQPVSLSRIIQAYKSSVTAELRRQHIIESIVWQKGFYDHIVRGDKDYESIYEYIVSNPAKWAEDQEYNRN